MSRGATRATRTTPEDASWFETTWRCGRRRRHGNLLTCTTPVEDAQLEPAPMRRPTLADETIGEPNAATSTPGGDTLLHGVGGSGEVTV
jgi:hypothetical protein